MQERMEQGSLVMVMVMVMARLKVHGRGSKPRAVAR